MIQVMIDQKKCVGCGFCMNCDSDLFEIDVKSFKAKLKQKNKLVDLSSIDISPKQLEKIKEIIKNCPAQAIKITK